MYKNETKPCSVYLVRQKEWREREKKEKGYLHSAVENHNSSLVQPSPGVYLIREIDGDSGRGKKRSYNGFNFYIGTDATQRRLPARLFKFKQ